MSEWCHDVFVILICTYTGPVDSNKTVFLDNTAVLLVTQGVYSAMTVIPKDSFGNQAVIEEQLIQIEIRKVNCVTTMKQ